MHGKRLLDDRSIRVDRCGQKRPLLCSHCIQCPQNVSNVPKSGTLGAKSAQNAPDVPLFGTLGTLPIFEGHLARYPFLRDVGHGKEVTNNGLGERSVAVFCLFPKIYIRNRNVFPNVPEADLYVSESRFIRFRNNLYVSECRFIRFRMSVRLFLHIIVVPKDYGLWNNYSNRSSTSIQ